MMTYTLRIHGTHKTTDVQLRQRRSEGTQAFVNRVYRDISERQAGLFNTVTIEVLNGGVLVDTFRGLIDRDAFYAQSRRGA